MKPLNYQARALYVSSTRAETKVEPFHVSGLTSPKLNSLHGIVFHLRKITLPRYRNVPIRQIGKGIGFCTFGEMSFLFLMYTQSSDTYCSVNLKNSFDESHRRGRVVKKSHYYYLHVCLWALQHWAQLVACLVCLHCQQTQFFVGGQKQVYKVSSRTLLHWANVF